jgi:hypothetical protein
MQLATRSWFAALVLGGLVASSAQAGSKAEGLLRKKGTPDFKSAGALGFAPEGILLIGDNQGAAVYAVDTGDTQPATAGQKINVEGINQKIASQLGTQPDQVAINDMAVNPVSGNAYLSVSRGRGASAEPVLVKVTGQGKVEVLSLKDVAYDSAKLPDPPAAGPATKGKPSRADVITDLAYTDGRLIVAGASNEEFASRLFSVPFPFADKPGDNAKIEIYHGAHGRFETVAPVRTFVAYKINNEPYIMAAYQCTPLVKIPVADLKPGAHVKGTTIAELGNRNKPLDMVVYKKDGKDYILLNNSTRGVMKIPTEGADKAPGIIKRVADREGMKYETIASLKNVTQLDALGDSQALILIQNGESQDLKTIDLP